MKKQNLHKAVIEINDVEYLIDENAARLIEKGENDIALLRLVDQTIFVFTLKEIKNSIKKNGIIDHLA